ncbi:MAG TPA: bifunctional methylenetetrahydrofolate dehydrogenase/methenyltetrahydrofolate cyclohydrolase FolD [Burkholderiales bacterium]|nr:bifunctional methylenetetrahydrofolate dehydrogenase/methenyltetrahydrofolate cyclohydrolase FolD [Burkholderiales bacterium]
MTARLLDGKALSASIRASVRERIAGSGLRPGLAVILAGEDPASKVYVRNKTRACEEAGVRSVQIDYPASVTQAELIRRISELNADPAIHGILVQLPLPRHIDSAAVLEAVSPRKDADGFHPASLGALLSGRPGFVPCTPAGIVRLVEHAGVPLAGRRAVVIGRSTIVGKPLALLLLQKDMSVTICHSKSRDLERIAAEADLLVAAVGKPKLVTAPMVKPGACVVDVGINRLPDGSLAGDVDFPAVREIAGWISPVPGGVGPMTIAMLLENCVHAAASEPPA